MQDAPTGDLVRFRSRFEAGWQLVSDFQRKPIVFTSVEPIADHQHTGLQQVQVQAGFMAIFDRLAWSKSWAIRKTHVMPFSCGPYSASALSQAINPPPNAAEKVPQLADHRIGCTLPDGRNVRVLRCQWILALHAPAALTSQLGQAFMKTLELPSYTIMVFGCELVCGILLLSGFWVPLALTVLAGILCNVLVFHIALEPKSLPIAVVSWVLWILVFVQYRASFAGIFVAHS